MTHGHFSLQPIFDYVRTVPRLPARDKSNTSPYGKYQLIAKSVITGVPNLTGWYLWATPGSPQSEIYVGKSEQGLFNRFVDRFNQEYTVFWEAVFGPHPLIEDAYSLFPQENYQKQIERYRCKASATHIVWVAKEDAGAEECEQVERELVKEFEPSCNRTHYPRNGKYRNLAVQVADGFRTSMQEIIKQGE